MSNGAKSTVLCNVPSGARRFSVLFYTSAVIVENLISNNNNDINNNTPTRRNHEDQTCKSVMKTFFSKTKLNCYYQSVLASSPTQVAQLRVFWVRSTTAVFPACRRIRHDPTWHLDMIFFPCANIVFELQRSERGAHVCCCGNVEMLISATFWTVNI